MKKYLLILNSENIEIETDKNEAETYCSYIEINDDDNIFYLCNTGNYVKENEYYFDEIEEVHNFIKNNQLPIIQIVREKEEEIYNENYNNFTHIINDYKLLETDSYSYFLYEYDEDEEEYIQLENCAIDASTYDIINKK